MNKHFNTAEGATRCNPESARFSKNRFNPYFTNAKAPVSIYKTENSYEVMVFAPGRVKENFKIEVLNRELIIKYTPTDDSSNLDWIRKEYSRGGFSRSFLLDASVTTENVIAKYEAGVLHIRLSILPGSEPLKQDIPVN